MRLLIVSLALIFSALSPVLAQKSDFLEIDKRATHTPFWVNYNTRKLSKHLTKKCSTDQEKVRSIYFWITQHIKYDAKRYQRNILKGQTPKKTLLRRKALCIQYAELFNELCKHAGITSITVEGYVKGASYEEDDIFHHSDHAWNIVEIDSSWHLLDLTFASGKLYLKPYLRERLRAIFTPMPLTKSKLVFKRERNDEYYRTAPKYFVINHLPITKDFQLLSKPISLEDFEKNKNLPPDDAELNKENFVPFNPEDPLSIIALADSNLTFNCRNALYQAKSYSDAGRKMLANSGEPTLNIARANDGLKYIDSSNKILPNSRAMIVEEAYYKTKKNIYRRDLCNHYLSQVKKGNNKIFSVGNIEKGNKRKIKYLKKQNRYANKLIRSYERKDISRIRVLFSMSQEKADSIISFNNKLIAQNIDSVIVKSSIIDSCYTLISNHNIQLLIQNQEQISALTEEIRQLSSHAAALRFDYLDNLDGEVKTNNEQRYYFVDSVEFTIRQRKPLRDTIRLNDKIIRKRMSEVKVMTARNFSLMKKNKRLRYYDANQFNKVKQEAIIALNTIKKKNSLLIEFTKQETRWGQQILKQSKSIGISTFKENVFEQNRYQYRNNHIVGNRKRLMKHCSNILKTNNYHKREALKALRKYK